MKWPSESLRHGHIRKKEREKVYIIGRGDVACVRGEKKRNVDISCVDHDKSHANCSCEA